MVMQNGKIPESKNIPLEEISKCFTEELFSEKYGIDTIERRDDRLVLTDRYGGN